MVLYQNDAFPQPDDNVKIWRYMPFEYFEKSLYNKSLWFGNAYNYDSDEGKLTAIEKVIHHSIQIENDVRLGNVIREPEVTFQESDKLKKDTFILCWAEGESESRKMWEDKTGNLPRDVVIQSSFWRLKQILDRNPRYGFWTVKVSYIDHGKHLSFLSHSLSHFARKNKAKAYEKEIRAMTTLFGLKGEGQNYRAGLEIETDFDFLIENIKVSPHSPGLLSEVKDLLNSNGLHKPVEPSAL